MRATVAVQLREASGGETSAAVLEALAAGVPVLTNMDSGRSIPTTRWRPCRDIGDSELATQIGDLMACPDRRRALSQAGKQFAAEHSFGRLAEAFLSIVTS